MKAVKTLQKYKCDFCKHRAIKSAMKRHEVRCYRNPNRFCSECKNTGEVDVEVDNPYGGTTTMKERCYFCSKFDPKMLAEIEAYEKGIQPPQSLTTEPAPF